MMSTQHFTRPIPQQISRRKALNMMGKGIGHSMIALGGVELASTLFGGVEQALAQTPSHQGGRYFLHLCFDGGWDLLLGLDPRNPLEFPDADAPITGIETGYTRLPIQFSRSPIMTDHFELGPCAGALAPWSSQIALIRGMDMATLTHEVGRRHLNTACVPSGLSARGSSITTRAAALTSMDGGNQVIPHLAHLVESYNEDLSSEATALLVSSVDHLQYLLQDTLGIPSYMPAHIRGALNRYWEREQESYETRWTRSDVNTHGRKIIERALQIRQQARQLVTRSLHESFQFSTPAQASLRAHYGITPQQLDTPAGRVALAAQALKTGLSRTVHLSVVNDLDTHDQRWAEDHSRSLAYGFEALAKLFSDLAESPDPLGGGSLLEHTTIVISSEFSRTPRLNVRGGRDHHLANAALLIGRGVKGGQVIGATTPTYLSPLRTHLETGQPDVSGTSGTSIRPEELMKTALLALGLSTSQQEIRGQEINAALW